MKGDPQCVSGRDQHDKLRRGQGGFLEHVQNQLRREGWEGVGQLEAREGVH